MVSVSDFLRACSRRLRIWRFADTRSNKVMAPRGSDDDRAYKNYVCVRGVVFLYVFYEEWNAMRRMCSVNACRMVVDWSGAASR